MIVVVCHATGVSIHPFLPYLVYHDDACLCFRCCGSFEISLRLGIALQVGKVVLKLLVVEEELHLGRRVSLLKDDRILVLVAVVLVEELVAEKPQRRHVHMSTD